MSNLEKRLCPDLDSIKDLLRVKNAYSNRDERVSFSIQAVVCNDATDSTCASSVNIDGLLGSVHFTTHVLHENLVFGEPENIGSKPTSIKDSFHSQFSLDRQRYVDYSNFI